MTYSGLSAQICQKAWEITLGTVLMAAANNVTNKLAGTIVVCVPRINDPDQGFDTVFIADVVGEHPDREKYEDIAVAKAEVSWLTGLPSRKVQQDAPFLYESGMTKWGGSVIENGLVVAFSGVQAAFDEAIAGTMLRWIVALCQDEMTREGGVMSQDTSFIGELTPELKQLEETANSHGLGAASSEAAMRSEWSGDD